MRRSPVTRKATAISEVFARSKVSPEELEVSEPLAGRNLEMAAKIQEHRPFRYTCSGRLPREASTHRVQRRLQFRILRSSTEVLGAAGSEPLSCCFSDDATGSSAICGFSAPATIVKHNGPAKDYEDMRCSAMRHHIIANSTFSWWGVGYASMRKSSDCNETWFRARTFNG